MPEGHEGMAFWECDAPLACAAKVENCCLRCSWPQEGQRTPSDADRRTSFSNLLPQSSHRYSKIGIGYSTSVKAILSIQARTSAGGAAKLLTRIEKASLPRVLLSAYPESVTARVSVPVLARTCRAALTSPTQHKRCSRVPSSPPTGSSDNHAAAFFEAFMALNSRVTARGETWSFRESPEPSSARHSSVLIPMPASHDPSSCRPDSRVPGPRVTRATSRNISSACRFWLTFSIT